ncbi:MAG: (d)CMP kinase [Gemmatimonadetes bacterium]|nr:(d)CMP kinase [Gemmatimonadota bacterium]
MSAPGRARTLVTLDGPAGSGKSTTAREVARRLGYRYLDSGALYRALTHALLEAGIPVGRWPSLEPSDLDALGVRVEPGNDRVRVRQGARLLDAELRRDEVTARVSDLARVPAVRGWLLDAQRDAGREGRLVADGRDMGSVVFPEAGVKVFLQADPRERARRRLRDKGVDHPDETRLDQEEALLRERDAKDEGREHAPLRVPEGALVLDTTHLTFQEQVERIVRRARDVAGG